MVIQDDTQYEVSRKQAIELATELTTLQTAQKPERMPDALWKAQREGMVSVYRELISEIREYEKRTNKEIESIPTTVKISVTNGYICIEFFGKVDGFMLAPKDAIELANTIISAAHKAGGMS